jgi:hypothetical protein
MKGKRTKKMHPMSVACIDYCNEKGYNAIEISSWLWHIHNELLKFNTESLAKSH